MATEAVAPQSKYELPDSDAKKADLLYKTREKRLKIQKQVDELQGLESALKEYFINSLPKDTSGVAGRVARVQTTPKAIPRVEDWGKFYAYVRSKKRFDLLQRRLSEAAVKEIWENGKTVPGVAKFTTVSVSCTKL
jgi:hypothetical protein